MVTHPDLDSWISLDRTGKPQKLTHGNFISTLGPQSWNLESRRPPALYNTGINRARIQHQYGQVDDERQAYLTRSPPNIMFLLHYYKGKVEKVAAA